MHQGTLCKTSEKFRRVLAEIKCNHIKRKELIKIAISVNQLSEQQACGLINRNIYLLKRQGLVTSCGGRNHRGYEFDECLLRDTRICLPTSCHYDLLAEKKALEKEVLMTQYEMQAYNELLQKMPNEKHKINRLHKGATEKLYQLNGKLRAVNQIIS